jgi:hypothetical protein
VKESQVRVGKNYLVHCGDWHTYVGRVRDQVGPIVYELEQVSKVEETHGGDNWHLLAAGDKAARDAASYLHYDTPVCLPLSIAAFEWVGELPPRPRKSGA